jgi:YVTN family beta-propeller protein
LRSVAALALACFVAPAAQAQNAYITNSGSNDVSVIDTATNTVVGSPIAVGSAPTGVAVTPDGHRVYVGNYNSSTVSVIDTATSTVIGEPITVGNGPIGVAVTPDGRRVYVANYNPNNVSVIDTATNTVIGSPIAVGINPYALGVFIQPTKKFAGTAGQQNCRGKSVSALAVKYDGIKGAAESLGYPSVAALQDAITTFCGG